MHIILHWWDMSAFPGGLPPPTVDQQNSMKEKTAIVCYRCSAEEPRAVKKNMYLKPSNLWKIHHGNNVVWKEHGKAEGALANLILMLTPALALALKITRRWLEPVFCLLKRHLRHWVFILWDIFSWLMQLSKTIINAFFLHYNCFLMPYSILISSRQNCNIKFIFTH